MLAEGFQCWSTTQEMDRYSRLASIPRVVSWVTQFNLQGDYDFFDYAGKPGQIHATGYTYFRHTPSNAIVFVGSTTEGSGYTYLKSDLNINKMSIYKDIEGKRLSKGQSLTIELYVAKRDHVAELTSVWHRYAAYYDPACQFQNPRHLTGWSSWYNYYEKVTERDVLSSLEAFDKHRYPIDVFQIDDGYESHIGDWLEVKSTFPRGMKVLAQDISRKGYLPGLWLAPFAVGFKSKIVQEHPEWLVKDANGSLVVAGPNWGGFYAIDIYHPEAKAYLKHVFDQVIDVWGFKLLKLDFLFAAAMIPRLGKSRGEIMWDAMDLIVEWNQKRALLLGSGVTLPSTWGRLDYSRVSSDASPWWDHTVLKLASVRERVATLNAMTSTLHRWPMASTVFGSDPDVFFIRSDNNKLTAEEKHTLLVINIVSGQLTLMSDNVDFYSPQEHQLYRSIFPKPEAQMQSVIQIKPDLYQAQYTCRGREYLFFSNLSPLPHTVLLPMSATGQYDTFFEHRNVLLYKNKVDWLPSQSQIFLKPHETRTFFKTSDLFMGSTGHIVPGTDIEHIQETKEGSIYVTMASMSKHTRLYFRIQNSLPIIYINNQRMPTEKIEWNEHISLAKVLIN
ncbi:glycoside hydrolase superfamily [Gilbertella persicaria]|nr:glycoside hydrolase superfamily [Gilbertella persicaria]KAI8091457.1 glycoside hydrolase superfamily [Gilbertella persicaria]